MNKSILYVGAIALLCVSASAVSVVSPASVVGGVKPTPEDAAWLSVTPSVVKKPIPVNLTRNPLQPAVVSSTAPFVNRDEVSLKLQAALEGKISSVVRGRSPAVMLGGRLFRLGDEFVEFVAPANGGAPRKQGFLPGHRVSLKAISKDSLRFQVESVDPTKPTNVFEASYRLEPAFAEK